MTHSEVKETEMNITLNCQFVAQDFLVIFEILADLLYQCYLTGLKITLVYSLLFSS